ncbi:amidohydrolase family protein [Parvularcula dongshanensis]|uniref:Imidazolonepropionase-like amidohydrolase n=1 Tax=Parvularcula dongshanensis TaxID=1173995 RepID=A0A840I4X6_9PROT|nr:amidohydrolase family protein [Parvularcula dongshanensis]MBB4659228.1 imidazolonepropionase-like amidohydrolase [Parvularcula dongshanensis]
MTYRALLCTLALSAAALPYYASAQTGGAVFFDDVSVFDGEKMRPRTVDVLVEDGRIERIGRRLKAPAGLDVVDGDGLFLIPGLIDSHVHAFGEDALEAPLRFGVTTQMDMFTDPSFAAAHRPQRDGVAKTDHADLYSAGTLITSAGGHGTQFGMAIPTIESADQAESFVRDRLAEGSDYIKVVYEPQWAGMTSIDRATLAAVIAAAHDQGAMAVVHVSRLEDARHALEAGADGLVHVFADQAPDEALLDLAEKSGAFVVATLAVEDGASGSPVGEDASRDPRLAAFLTPPQEGQLAARFPPQMAAVFSSEAAHAAVRALHERGVPILAGTDAPNPGTTYGASLHTELKLLTEAGLTPEEALRAATSAPADAFGLEDRGRIEKGLRADLVLLSADPTKDVTNSRAIEAVYKNGYEVDRSVPEPQATQAVDALPGGLIADFGQDLSTAYGVPVMGTSDEMAGGKSTVAVSHTDDGRARASGAVSTEFPFPWAGLGVFLSFDGTRSADWSGYSTLRFEGRSDHPLTLMLFTKTSPQTPAMASVPIGEAWGSVSVDLAAISGADLSDVWGFAITAGRPAGDFEFEVDDLTLE